MTDGRPGLVLTIRCKASDWQLSSLTQVCDPPFVSLFNLERLEIREDSYHHDHIGKRMWRTSNGWNFYIHLPP
jgi:hypothetical protein